MKRTPKAVTIALTRRNLLVVALAFTAITAAHGEAYARATMFRGAGNLIVINPPAISLVFSNLTGSASPSDTNVVWGQLCKKGDIPAGQSPILKVNGINYQVQCDQVVTHNDGSLFFAKCTVVLPSIAANTSVSAFISSQNSAITNNPSRTTADVTALGARIHLTNVKNISGTAEGSGSFTIDVNRAITAGGTQVQTVNAGSHQGEWKVIAYAYDDSTDARHPHLRGEFFITPFTKNDTTLGATQLRAYVDNGHLQSMADGMAAHAVCTGTTPSSTTVAGTAGTATASISGTTLTVTALPLLSPNFIAVGQSVTGTNIPFGITILSQLSGTPGGVGTYQLSASAATGSQTTSFLPSFTFTVAASQPLSVGQAVTAASASGNYMSGIVISYSGTTLVVAMSAKVGFSAATNWFLIPTPSIYTMDAELKVGAGAGATASPASIRTITGITCAHHSGFAVAGSTGRRDWSDGRADIFVRQDPSYLAKSDGVSPYDTTLALSVNDGAYTPATYSPMITGHVGQLLTDPRNGLGYTSDRSFYNEGSGSISSGTNSAGDRPDIGVWPAWDVRAWLSQGPNFLQTAYVRSLAMRTANLSFRDPTTWRVPVLNNGSDGAGTHYSGLGSNYPLTYQNANTSQLSADILNCFGGNNGWTGTAGANTAPDMEHWPSCHFGVYLLTGEYDHLDMAMNEANQAVMTKNPGIGRNINKTVGGTNYKFWGSCCDNGNNVRAPAWALCQLAQVMRFLPDAAPEKPYFTDLALTYVRAANWYFNVYYPSLSNLAPAFPSLGLPWYPLSSQTATWNVGAIHWFMGHHLLKSAALMVKMSQGHSDALAFGNYLMKFYKGLADTGMSPYFFQWYLMGAYTLDEVSHNTISSFGQIGFYPVNAPGGVDGTNHGCLIFTNGSNVVTLGNQVEGWSASASLTSAPLIKPVHNQPIRTTRLLNLAGGYLTTGPVPPAEAPVGTTLYIQHPTVGSTYDGSSGHEVVTSGTNQFGLSLTPDGALITFTSDTPLGVCFVVMSPPAANPLAEFQSGGGIYGPAAYGNDANCALIMANWAGLNDAATVQGLVGPVQATYYTSLLTANTPANNPKIALKLAA